MTGDLISNDQAERERQGRFNSEQVVTRHYDRAPLRQVVLDLVRDYGAPYDLSVGMIDCPNTPVTVDWSQGRSLRGALDDLANLLAVRWQTDGDHRLHVRELVGPHINVGDRGWMPVKGFSFSYTTGTGARFVQDYRPKHLGGFDALLGVSVGADMRAYTFTEPEGDDDGTP